MYTCAALPSHLAVRLILFDVDKQGQIPSPLEVDASYCQHNHAMGCIAACTVAVLGSSTCIMAFNAYLADSGEMGGE